MATAGTVSGPIPFGPNHELRQMEPAERLFVHKRHPEWGVGLWVREEMTRRRFRFDDGELRAFKKGYYHLLEPVDVDDIDVEEKFEEIGSEHDVAQAEARKARLRKKKAPVMTLKQQVRVFKHLYPDGFEGSFITEHIRPEGGRARKSHHGASVDLAQELLTKEALEPLVKEGDWLAIHDRAVQVMKSTTLVSRTKDMKPVEELDDEKKVIFAKALYDLLYGEKEEERYMRRFGKFLATLRKDCRLKPQWGLASVFPALLFPTEHVAVKPRAFDLQGREVSPGKVVEKRPSKAAYKRARRIVIKLRNRLKKKHELVAPDLMHVRVFIWETLRPRGRKTLEEMEGR